jgi:hypothetical protein
VSDEETIQSWTTLLQHAGVAEAAGEPLDVQALAAELGVVEVAARATLERLEATGLVLSRLTEHGPPMLLRAGRQFLHARGKASWEVLHFLPNVIDDLHAREALLVAGSVLVDEFRYQLLRGTHAEHASELVPPAFAEAVDEVLAVDLFAAAVALLARLSAGEPAGCVAEEILAVRLIEDAAGRLQSRAASGELTEEEAAAAIGELNGLFELFQDDDVLKMFDMEEPADAALAEHDPVHQQLGVADHRVENWFRPFAGTMPTGYLNSD